VPLELVEEMARVHRAFGERGELRGRVRQLVLDAFERAALKAFPASIQRRLSGA
jgi:hypothetical protein